MDNELSSEERFLMDAHLQKCPSCAREAETLDKIAVFMGSIPEETPSQDFVWRTVSKAAAMRRRWLREKRFLNPVFSFVRVAIAFVVAPGGYSTHDESSLSSHGYLRTFDDSPPGSFADVYLTVIQGGGN